jgi:hypothetical protein
MSEYGCDGAPSSTWAVLQLKPQRTELAGDLVIRVDFTAMYYGEVLADGVGFEPTVPLRARRFSRPVP